MTGKEVQIAIGKMQVLKPHPVVCENIMPLFRWEMDVMSINKAGMVFEFEVKISRSDFLADKRKGKNYFYAKETMYKPWVPNYFSYACPEGLISESEIPKGCGLYYVNKKGEAWAVKTPSRIHADRHDRERIITKVLRLQQERLFLGCARLTYENRLIKERRTEYESCIREPSDHPFAIDERVELNKEA